jgi:5-(carboxyamino)imidazole ribonucleotide synthase
LSTTQERVREKEFLREVGIPVPAFAPVTSQAHLLPALEEIGWPAVLKRTRGGYDGKGQAVIHEPKEAEGAWSMIGGGPAILERLVPFERELSIIAVRSTSGDIKAWPLVENHHHGGILRWSVAPAPRLSPKLQAEAESHARRLMEELDYVGVLTIEFFEVGGQLWANEIAPRVHNSGHWTIEGAYTSQFENHLRAIASLPLGPTAERGPTAMVNLIGTLPPRHELLAVPGARVHLYGKPPRPGRKLGHITLVANDETQRDQALQGALRIVGV